MCVRALIVLARIWFVAWTVGTQQRVVVHDRASTSSDGDERPRAQHRHASFRHHSQCHRVSKPLGTSKGRRECQGQDRRAQHSVRELQQERADPDASKCCSLAHQTSTAAIIVIERCMTSVLILLMRDSRIYSLMLIVCSCQSSSASTERWLYCCAAWRPTRCTRPTLVRPRIRTTCQRSLLPPSRSKVQYLSALSRCRVQICIHSSRVDAEMLQRMQDRGQQITLKLTMEAKSFPQSLSRNSTFHSRHAIH